MKQIYNGIIQSINSNNKLLAVLIDPDKMDLNNVEGFIKKLNTSIATHIFVGGSTVGEDATQRLVFELKKHTEKPLVLFPGDVSQITNEADALLFLSLISGRNPEYLIGKHVDSISKLRTSDLEVIPTGYILIENGKETAVQRVTGTEPIRKDAIEQIVNTAKAGEYLGMKLIYLEAGSGASQPVSAEVIRQVRAELNIPIIVGGGIRTREQLDIAFNSGADIVVIGTAIEEDDTFFNVL